MVTGQEKSEVRAKLGLMYHLGGDCSQVAGRFELALQEKSELIVLNALYRGWP